MAEVTVSQQAQEKTTGGFNLGAALTIASAILMLVALYMALLWAPDAANLTSPAERWLWLIACARSFRKFQSRPRFSPTKSGFACSTASHAFCAAWRATTAPRSWC